MWDSLVLLTRRLIRFDSLSKDGKNGRSFWSQNWRKSSSCNMQRCKMFMHLTIQKSKAQQLTWGLEAYQLLHASRSTYGTWSSSLTSSSSSFSSSSSSSAASFIHHPSPILRNTWSYIHHTSFYNTSWFHHSFSRHPHANTHIGT